MFNVGDFVISTMNTYDVYSGSLIKRKIFCVLAKYKFLSIMKYVCASQNEITTIVLDLDYNKRWKKLND
jgi:hypothetical protein